MELKCIIAQDPVSKNEHQAELLYQGTSFCRIHFEAYLSTQIKGSPDIGSLYEKGVVVGLVRKGLSELEHHE